MRMYMGKRHSHVLLHFGVFAQIFWRRLSFACFQDAPRPGLYRLIFISLVTWYWWASSSIWWFRWYSQSGWAFAWMNFHVPKSGQRLSFSTFKMIIKHNNTSINFKALQINNTELLLPFLLQPKLTMAKCRRNVENFLEACRKIGVPQVRQKTSSFVCRLLFLSPPLVLCDQNVGH